MKIEKISENQIRCTLSREDLVDRELRISELAYGTEKAKALFRDMMQQAHYEFGFNAEDIPLMIEAIPVSPECLVLVITKVEDPDELDTRFSKFSPDDTMDYEDNSFEDGYDEDDSVFDGSDIYSFDSNDDTSDDYSDDESEFDISENFLPLPASNSKNKENNKKHSKSSGFPVNIVKIYSFQNLDEVIQMSRVVADVYVGKNSLYKNPVNSIFYLVINRSSYSSDEFNKIGNLVSEYGVFQQSTYASPYHYDEHYEVIIKDNAIQILTSL